MPETVIRSGSDVRKCDFVYDSRLGEGGKGKHKKSRHMGGQTWMDAIESN